MQRDVTTYEWANGIKVPTIVAADYVTTRDNDTGLTCVFIVRDNLDIDVFAIKSREEHYHIMPGGEHKWITDNIIIGDFIRTEKHEHTVGVA